MAQNKGSFRDPDGYIFELNDEIFRYVNDSYHQNFEHFVSSGLCKRLVDLNYLLPFVEVDRDLYDLPEAFKVLKPERIRFISYPYEWSFNMLKDAAILTLEIQKMALKYGMSLKDASAYNIQFQDGNPIFIDTLSFELFVDDHPWVAYRQFCQHFLAPLALMAEVDPRLHKMMIFNLDGIPLDKAVKILPFLSRFNLGLYFHLFLHSKMQKKHENDSVSVSDKKRKFSLSMMNALVDGLKSAVLNLHWKQKGTEWVDYTDLKVHKQEYTIFKAKAITELLQMADPRFVWDLGSNTGFFSRLAAEKGIEVISMDVDPACVDINYNLVKEKNETKIMPLLLDVLNPTPSLGWGGAERFSIFQRKKPDMIMALALIHHLAISSNVSLNSIALLFSQLTNWLLIEFVPKEDDKVQFLLQNRKDIFPDYNRENFEKIFINHFRIEKIISSDCNLRTLYLMEKKKTLDN